MTSKSAELCLALRHHSKHRVGRVPFCRIRVNKHHWVCLLLVLCIVGSEAGASETILPRISRVAATQSPAVEAATAARELAAQGQFQQAIELTRHALKLAEQEFGPEH